MTKRKVEHPTRERGATQDERGDWTEARHFAGQLLFEAQQIVDYLDEKSGDPSAAFTAKRFADRMASAVERALARRQTRLKLKEKRA